VDTSWKELGGELKHRLLEPAKHASFVFYFLGASFVAAMGVWFALTSGSSDVNAAADSANLAASPSKVFDALLTYFPAVGSIACLQVIVVENARKYLRSVFMFLLIFFIALTWAAGFLFVQNPCLAWVMVIFGTLIALIAWWISIGREEGLRDKPNSTDSLGGSSNTPPAGSSKEFKT